MRRLLLSFLFLPLVLAAANVKLYMKDGGYQLVREFKVEGDRVKFYSIERSEWEEMPVTMIDPKGHVRIAERLTIEAVVKETVEERDSLQVFTKQLTDGGLYKIWPQEALEKGEYAVIEYTEGKVNPQIWDFRVE